MKLPEVIGGVVLLVTVVLLLMLAGCVRATEVKPIRLDITCVGYSRANAVVIQCADQKSWEEFYARQKPVDRGSR